MLSGVIATPEATVLRASSSHPKTLFCSTLPHVSFIFLEFKILQSGGAKCMFLSLFQLSISRSNKVQNGKQK